MTIGNVISLNLAAGFTTMHYFFLNIVVPFLIGCASSALVIVLGLKNLRDYIDARERAKTIGSLEKFWATRNHHMVFHIVYGAARKKMDNEFEPLLSYSITYGVSEIVDCVHLVFGGKAVIRHVIVPKDGKIDTKLFDDNVIILGGELSVSQFGDISRAICVPYYQYDLHITDRKFTTHSSITPKEQIVSDFKDGNLVTDIGTVTRLINPRNGNLLILFNGNYGAGLLGSILSVTRNQSHLSEVESDAPAQQLIICVPNIADNMIDSDHAVKNIRPWTRFNLQQTDLHQVLIGANPSEVNILNAMNDIRSVPNQKKELLVLLGNTNSLDGSISEITKSRARLAIELLQQEANLVVIATGGFGKEFNESSTAHGELVSKFLIANGIDKTRIWPYASGSNTVQDAMSVLKALEEEGHIQRVHIVTSRFHGERVKYIFEQLFRNYELEYHFADDPTDPVELAALRRKEKESLANLQGMGLKAFGQMQAS